ncbi:nicotinate-nucleotide--dimethylbenzimidazole phosphoribosyltransferase [Thalassotalea sp. 1_MG-2023]|uniref:nicotinate-nucleotide--dimethylbenzimidazole phosphoribosyltransferase n=1 Tax=Thalassotalea sp. 1_MG-2023 TaxID=3062680 RepID=UPI0026E1294D|nr:nicotinate-nucleotide--dimethylbenzimidazole phosphoribosyltransferase [Thalassotalea sp. 1_MG-2023]MDO6427020.1 nicotinate-nucleotide--dimethylbenzimidazole phosphoribosyltransferase [Thalassotalea sp. 1_MG-2023]
MMFNVPKLTQQYLPQITNKIDQKTKPLGALGALEQLAMRLAIIQSDRTRQWQNIDTLNAQVIVFAGDHGIANQGVSIAPSDVTYQMVVNFLNGGAAINCFCRCHNMPLSVVDTGMCTPLPEALKKQHRNFFESRLGAGTHDISGQAAMTIAQVNNGLSAGESIAERAIEQGCNVLIFGEMGIANTSAASAITSTLLDIPVDRSVGLGTGITTEQLAVKKQLISQGLTRLKAHKDDVSITTILAELGGFEIVHIVGAILASAKRKVPVLVDGFIVSTAALVAHKIAPEVSDYLIFAHQSHEHAHQQILEHFHAQPLLQLALRLGEGTGAALAFPLLQAAVSFYNDMASFESAGVTV